MRYRRFVPAFDGLSLRIAPSSLAGALATPVTAAPALTSVADTSDPSTAAASTSLSASFSPYTCAVPTTAQLTPMSLMQIEEVEKRKIRLLPPIRGESVPSERAWISCIRNSEADQRSVKS